VLLGFGLLRLKSREEELGPPTRDTSKVWRASQWKLGWKLLIVVVYCAFNIFILSVSAKYPSTGADNPYVSVTGHIYPSITFGLLCLALLYYGATFLGLGRNPTVAWYKSVIPWTGVTSTICKAPAYNVLETKVYRFGSRRTITFTVCVYPLPKKGVFFKITNRIAVSVRCWKSQEIDILGFGWGTIE